MLESSLGLLLKVEGGVLFVFSYISIDIHVKCCVYKYVGLGLAVQNKNFHFS